MNHLTESMTTILSRRDSRWVIILTTLCFFFILLLVTNGKNAFEVLSFEVFPWPKRIELFVSVFFSIRDVFTTGSLILATLGAILGGINVSLAYTYMRLRGALIVQSGLYSGVGLLLAFLGVGCAACGTALLSVILSFLGFSSMLSILPYQGMEVGYIGLIILFMATYYLAKKVAAPGVC